MFSRSLISAFCLIALGCQTQSDPRDKDVNLDKQSQPAPLYIGTVQQIYPQHKFVLVRLVGPQPAVGTTLISHPADNSNLRIGNLSASAEKIQNSISRMIAADWRGGEVMRGDAVYIYRNISDIAKSKDDGNTKPPVGSNLGANPVATASASTKTNAINQTAAKMENSSSSPFEPTATPKDALPKPSPGQRSTPKSVIDVPDNINEWDL